MDGSRLDEPVRYYFGFRSDDLETVAETLAPMLSIEWQLRDADSRGGDYYQFKEGNSRTYWLQKNHAEFLSWVAPAYSAYPLILGIYWQDRTSAPNSADLLQKFSTVFIDVILIPEDQRFKVTAFQHFKAEPIVLVVWVFAFFAKLLKLP